MPINKFVRYQKRFYFFEMYTQVPGYCCCGCGVKLTGRKTRWEHPSHAKKFLTEFYILKGDTKIIRDELMKRDKGICVHCGEDNEFGDWDADHIIEVRHGGGGCGLDNFQTLCKTCHKRKTKLNYK